MGYRSETHCDLVAKIIYLVNMHAWFFLLVVSDTYDSLVLYYLAVIYAIVELPRRVLLKLRIMRQTFFVRLNHTSFPKKAKVSFTDRKVLVFEISRQLPELPMTKVEKAKMSSTFRDNFRFSHREFSKV